MGGNGYAKEVLVTTEWLAEQLDDPNVVVAEVDENPALYDEGHVPAALRAFLLVAGRRDQVARVLLRAPHVHERARLVAEAGQHVVAERPDRCVALASLVRHGLA